MKKIAFFAEHIMEISRLHQYSLNYVIPLFYQIFYMRIAYLEINNFRGISQSKIFFDGHSVIIGDNNAGKSTIFEAIDLVLGPDRLSRTPVIDEHDFYNGLYYASDGISPEIKIELVIIDLATEQISRFRNHLEFWNEMAASILPPGSIDQTNDPGSKPALRVRFVGKYNEADDDFEGATYFCWPSPNNENSLTEFRKSDKRQCGFLYLRALRTGSRALSMERGSLLDIILRIREIRPKMWEDILGELKRTNVATSPILGIKSVLEGVQEALKDFVPSDWGSEPILRVSNLTREHLRKTLTIFMSTGSGTYHAPFQHQGTGTINTMVLALLSMIAEAKKNVIFAMEEPEIAIPPYTQKRIVNSIISKSTQAIFTSHSPFVLEEFPPGRIIHVQRNQQGVVESQFLHFPSSVKPKQYSAQFRLRFSEALLAKRVLLVEGATEASAYSAAGRRLHELEPPLFTSLEAMGVAIFDVAGQSLIASYGDYFTSLGKTVFAVFDKQSPDALAAIQKAVSYPFESAYKGFEELLMDKIPYKILEKFYKHLVDSDEWPTHLNKLMPNEEASSDAYEVAVKEYLKWAKGAYGAAELISMCESKRDVPLEIRQVLAEIKRILTPVTVEIENSNGI